MRVLFFIFFIFFVWPFAAEAAVRLYFIPAQLDVNSDSFAVEVVIDSDEMINAIDARLSWPTDKLKWLQSFEGGSVFDLWVKPPRPIKRGEMRLLAGATKPFSGNAGKVATIIFQPLQKGKASLLWSDGVRVLLADGQGSEAEVETVSADYSLTPEESEDQVTSANQPLDYLWYNNSDFDVNWQVKPGFEYSYLLTKDPTLTPDDLAEEKVGSIRFEGLDDGIYYFHLKSRPAGGEWGRKVTKRVQIDRTPPYFIEINKQSRWWSGSVKIFFAAADNLSGIYEFVLDLPSGQSMTVSNPIKLERRWFDYTVYLSAIDQAGNKQTEAVRIFGWAKIMAGILAVVLIIVVIVYNLYKRLMRRR